MLATVPFKAVPPSEKWLAHRVVRNISRISQSSVHREETCSGPRIISGPRHSTAPGFDSTSAGAVQLVAEPAESRREQRKLSKKRGSMFLGLPLHSSSRYVPSSTAEYSCEDCHFPIINRQYAFKSHTHTYTRAILPSQQSTQMMKTVSVFLTTSPALSLPNGSFAL
jgi:hypothetical protein